MTDKTELEVTREDRVAAWPYRADYYREEDINGWLRGEYDHNRIIQALARHRLATRATDPTPVAKVRVKHGGYGMELATYVAYGLPEGDHWLYAHPPAAPADGLVEALYDAHLFSCMVLAFIGRDRGTERQDAMLDGLCVEASKIDDQLRTALAAYRGEA